MALGIFRRVEIGVDRNGTLVFSTDGGLTVHPAGSSSDSGGSGAEGSVSVFTFADEESTDDTKGVNGDLAILLDSKTIVEKAGGVWAIA